jgi:hypothetical protein
MCPDMCAIPPADMLAAGTFCGSACTVFAGNAEPAATREPIDRQRSAANRALEPKQKLIERGDIRCTSQQFCFGVWRSLPAGGPRSCGSPEVDPGFRYAPIPIQVPSVCNLLFVGGLLQVAVARTAVNRRTYAQGLSSKRVRGKACGLEWDALRLEDEQWSVP